jgi:hypothetical protein
MSTTTFTIEDALTIQEEQVSRWAKVLNAEALLMLRKGIAKINAKGYKSASEVFRGVDIDMFIHNECMKKL